MIYCYISRCTAGMVQVISLPGALQGVHEKHVKEFLSLTFFLPTGKECGKMW